MRLKNNGNVKLVTVAAVGLVFMLASFGCSETPDAKRIREWQQKEAEQRHLHQGGKWHFEFDSVRLYRTNWAKEDPMEDIVSNGRLNETREPLDGILLTSTQVKKLESAVTGSHPEVFGAMCFYPHHGFVFFDKNGTIVGSIDICFKCSNYQGNPEGFALHWDLLAIAELVHELGVPLSNPDWDKPENDEENQD